MKILIVNNRYFPAIGGAEVSIKILAETLAKNGHEVHVATSRFKYASGYNKFEKSNEIINDVSIHRLNGIRIISDPLIVLPGLVNFIRNNKFDLIHVFTYGYHTSWGPLIAKGLGLIRTPVVFTAHYAPSHTVPTLLRRLFDLTLGKVSIRQADKITLLTEEYKEFFDRNGEVAIIPPFWKPLREPLARQIEIMREQLEIPLSHKVFMTLSRLVDYKGIMEVINGFLKADLSKASLIVAGDGELVPHVRKAAENNKNIVIMKSPSDLDKSKLFHIADVFLNLSKSGESFGITLLEAMQSGCGLIISDKGALKQVAKPGENALMVDPLDIDAVVNAYRTLNDDGETLKSMQERNLKRITEFDNAKAYSKIEAVYQSII